MGEEGGAAPAGQPAEPDPGEVAAAPRGSDRSAGVPQPTRAATPADPRQPDKSVDELDVGWGERPSDDGRLSENDEMLLRERPPHWE